MKGFGYFISAVIFLFGVFTGIKMYVEGVDNNYIYVIPALFIVIGTLLFLVIKYEKGDIY